MSRPEGGNDLAEPEAAARSGVGREGDGVEVEHDVGDDRAEAGAADLGGDVGQEVAGGEPAEDAVGEGDDGVEVGARHRPEGEDERDEPAGGGGGVLEQLQASVARGQTLRHDPRADDDGDEERGAGGFGGDAPAERWRSSAAGPAAFTGGGDGVGESREASSDGCDRQGAEPVVGPVPELGGVDEPGVAQDAQVVAHERLGEREGVDEVADAQLFVGEELDDAPADRFGDAPSELRSRPLPTSRSTVIGMERR